MDIGNIRDFVAAGYKGDKWKNKVNKEASGQISNAILEIEKEFLIDYKEAVYLLERKEY